MNFQDYINQQNKLYKCFLLYINEDNFIDQRFDDLIKIINLNQYQKNSEEFKSILYLISEIGKNHQRSGAFSAKIERILQHYAEYIKQNYSKDELFNIFRKNLQILRFLFKQSIIIIDDEIIELLLKGRDPFFVFRQYNGEKEPDKNLEKQKYNEKKSILNNYKYYFFEDIKSHLDNKTRSTIEKELFEMNDKIFDDFDKKCQTGENDSYISQLIREDSVQEFIAYVNKNNIPLNGEVTQSIFETNQFLIQKPASVSIPSSVTSIGINVFAGCSSMTNIKKINKIRTHCNLFIKSILP